MSTRRPSESVEVDYRPSWDLEDSTNNDSGTSVSRESPTDRRVATNVRKRNKPTLSCTACVNKRTKCDRIRPRCDACHSRHTICEYQGAANPESDSEARAFQQQDPNPAASESTVDHNSQQQMPFTSIIAFPSENALDLDAFQSVSSLIETTAPSHSTMTPTLLSTVRSFSQDPPALSNLFGMAAQHPFRNLWTDAGGLAEVIAVMPTKAQADWLIERYFQIVDPIYPIICKEFFMVEYNDFWNTPQEDKHLCDPAHLALQLAMFTTSAAYGTVQPDGERNISAVFYLSCCYQCLCVSSYLNSCSLSTLQTMVLITNYLIASHRGSDAWIFSGIAQRQAYGLQLHQNPVVVAPFASTLEQRTRCRLWLATMFQDTSLAMYFELPPATMFYQIKQDCLDQFEEQPVSTPSATDTSYLKATWQYTQFLQKYMCVNKALKQNYAKSAAHKTQLVSQLRALYSNFDFPFNSSDPARFEASPERLARQLISLASNYYFVFSLLSMDNKPSAGVEFDVYGTLEASHEGMASFFALARMFPGEIEMWGAPQIRAYSQAIIVANILKQRVDLLQKTPSDPYLMLAKSNLDRYIDILLRPSSSLEYDAIRRGRLADLQSLINQNRTEIRIFS